MMPWNMTEPDWPPSLAANMKTVIGIVLGVGGPFSSTRSARLSTTDPSLPDAARYFPAAAGPPAEATTGAGRMGSWSHAFWDRPDRPPQPQSRDAGRSSPGNRGDREWAHRSART